MKISSKITWISVLAGFLLTVSCEQTKSTELVAENTKIKHDSPSESLQLSEEFKAYWYAGTAEITSYKLEQARYGELRDGHAVLIYVTEDFLPDKQVKADAQNPDNISVLKLNATKEFNTGIYPYSVMQSTFYPVSNDQHAIKVSNSIQEWCGQVYTQINNRNQFEVVSHSYFESEADQQFKLSKTVLENEIWTQIRIDPNTLPQGTIQVIPSLEYIRFKHIPLKAYTAQATLTENMYRLNYPDLDRSLTINFNSEFPYEILGWEESFRSGFGSKAKQLITKASKLETIKSKYWQKNSNTDESLRKSLRLE